MNLWTAISRLILFTTLLGLLVVCPVLAQVHLSFTPADTTVALGQPGRLSIMVDESFEYRTIDVTVTYDTTIVRSLGGTAGALYTDSGIFTFKGFEEDTLGTWHGYAVLMGAGLFIKGPGELYYWDFEGLAEGTTPITSVKVFVSTTDGSWFEDVSLPATTIIVGDPLSNEDDVPSFRSDLRIWPNPFNPRTEIVCDLDRAGWVELAVYDVRGRQVVVLYEGSAPAGPFTSSWNGLDSRGISQPGGVYLFGLATSAGRLITKGVLLK